LNRTFQMEHHDRKFFSAWDGVYSRSQRTITYSNAGHPPAVLFDPAEKKLTRTASTGPVLGILPTFEMPEVTIDFPPGTELLLFTDGLYELLGADSGRGSYDEFVTWLEAQSAAGKPTWETMLHWYGKARDKHAVDDDVTLMRFTTAA
jgi:sigma-B regulation protein RsbU (phosphoserine phosphatase)